MHFDFSILVKHNFIAFACMGFRLRLVELQTLLVA